MGIGAGLIENSADNRVVDDAIVSQFQ